MAQPTPALAAHRADSESDLIGVDEARARILAVFAPLAAIELPLVDALGLVSAEAVVSGVNVPPFANSAMDGFAVRAADTAGASPQRPIQLRVIGEATAGHSPSVCVTPGAAVRIMTGASVPDGADAVVRFEETDEFTPGLDAPARRDGRIGILRAASPRQNIRLAGEDVRAGETVLQAGTRLRPAEIGLLAAIGRTHVAVNRRPRVAILATGDEVAEPGGELGPGQLWNSNSVTVAAMVRRYGGEPLMLGVARDAATALQAKLREAGDADLLITTGGVSIGDYDVVKDVLRIEGRIELWQVRIKPGKPLAFGKIGGTPLLGLPGNPVAAVVAFEQFGRPALLKMLGHRDLTLPTVLARLADRVENRGGRRHFVRVRLEMTEAGYVAHLAGGQGAGILSTLARADGLLIVPENLPVAEPEMVLPVQLLD